MADAVRRTIDAVGEITVHELNVIDAGGAAARRRAAGAGQREKQLEENRRLAVARAFCHQHASAFYAAVGADHRKLSALDAAAINAAVRALGWTPDECRLFALGARKRDLSARARKHLARAENGGG